MGKGAIKAVLLSSIVAVGVGIAAPSSASPTLRRLRNADTSHGAFYLGIPPGPQNGHVNDNQNLIVWQFSQNDQLWWVPDDAGYGQFSDFYTDFSNASVCLGIGSGGHIIDQVCDANNEVQFWQLIGSNKVGLDGQYPGCYILWNGTTGQAIGVSGSVVNGSSVMATTYNGSANQFWCEN
jgi:hypothetical protein